jgi:aminodeoxyfutalosine synthase
LEEDRWDQAAMTILVDLETKVAADQPFTRADAERLASCADLVSVGALGEAVRRARRGNDVSYCRVFRLEQGLPGAGPGEAGEVRLVGSGSAADQAALVERVRAARAFAGDKPLTGFSLDALIDLAGGDHLALADLAAALREAGLEAVADAPIDRLGDTENAVEIVRATMHGGLGVWRATIRRADASERLDLIERAIAIQQETRAFRAFAPLPIEDPANEPSTGYDDVRTVAVARCWGAELPSVQVDWAIYGPKLAQVAIAFGADDLDGVSAIDELQLGHRRSPKEDIERQIRAAFANPVERNGRYETMR